MMISLLILLPVVLLLLAVLGIFILQQARPSIGYAWLIGAVAGLAAVGVTIYLRWRLPLELMISQWQTYGELSSPIAFRLDLSSWPYVFSLVVLALSFILTDAARLETEARPVNWAAGLLLAVLGIFAVMAANPVTLVTAWTAVDMAECIMVLSTAPGRRLGAQTVTFFSVRVAGTVLVIMAILFARSKAIPFDLSPIPASLGVYMLMAVGLRLGVLPLNVPYSRDVYTWRGLGNVMRMIGPASSLVVLGRMPEQVIPAQWKGILLAFTVLAALYGSGMWLVANHELNGRPYWFTALAAMAVASVINGHPQASIAWGLVLIFSGSVLFFYSARMRQIYFIPFLGMLGLAGLPYNPAAAGWLGLASGSVNLPALLFLVSVLFLFWGYLRLTMRTREELYPMERWVHAVYPAGLLFLVLGQWVVGIFGWPGSLTPGVWWAEIGMALAGVFGVILAYSLRRVFTGDAPAARWISVFVRWAGGGLGTILRLNWLYRFLALVYQSLQNLIQVITGMFEGDGGILWSLVMLALLISLIRASTGGIP